jgi:hypothetical protein
MRLWWSIDASLRTYILDSKWSASLSGHFSTEILTSEAGLEAMKIEKSLAKLNQPST